ncbi:hypothetical protein [Microtetraspora fusca]|uniref:SMI1/KNR4 family protein n=1 Tax=Microtetraspora fusca TaxID=1997 RepID=A0ABW6V993_MICFU|nr:hypothetical protein [Microtetraspora fusca]
MSEPNSAMVQISITRPRLLDYLESEAVAASSWSDWDTLFDRCWWSKGPAERSRLLAGVDGRLADACYRTLMRSLLTIPLGCPRFSYNDESGTLLLSNLGLGEGVDDYVFFLATVRALASYMEDGDEGFAVIRNYLWGDRYTLACLCIAPGISRFVDPQDDEYKVLIEKADAFFDLWYELPGPNDPEDWEPSASQRALDAAVFENLNNLR